MSSKQMFSGFNQEQYEAEVRQRWGDTDAYKQSVQRWGSYTQAKKEQVLAEAGKIYEDFVANMDRGHASKEVQAICARWHENLRYFYDPTPEILMGLGQMYNEHPEFRANFQKMHPDLPGFLQQAIDYYCVEVLVVG